MERVLTHLLGILGAKLQSVGVNYHHHFKLNGPALAVILSLIKDRGSEVSAVLNGQLVSGGVRMVYNRPDGRYDIRLETLVPPRSQHELSCHLNIHHEADSLGTLLGRAGEEQGYLATVVARLCSQAAEEVSECTR